MANNTTCPEVLARLILKNDMDRDEYHCSASTDNPPSDDVWDMLKAERAELEAEWLELTGNEWTWKDLNTAWTKWEIMRGA